jgi:hypothetical protein
MPTLHEFKRWLNEPINKTFGAREVKILPPLRPTRNGRAGLRPHHERTAEVMRVLDEAPEGATYEQLIAHVRERSHMGCSRRLVAKWRKAKCN